MVSQHSDSRLVNLGHFSYRPIGLLPMQRQSVSLWFPEEANRRVVETSAYPNIPVETQSCRQRCERIHNLEDPWDRAIQEWPIPRLRKYAPGGTPSPPPQNPPRTSG